MKSAPIFAFCGILSWLAFGCISPAGRQSGYLMLYGEKARVLLKKEPDRVTVSIIAPRKSSPPIDWSKVKIQMGAAPFGDLPGTFVYYMQLAGTNVTGDSRASASFTFQADPAIIDDVPDVIINDGKGNYCTFDFPLSHTEVLARFRGRASAQEFREFAQLRRSKKTADRDRALEIVLFKLNWYELGRIGIRANPSTVTFPPHSKENSSDQPLRTFNSDWWTVTSGSFLWGDPRANAINAELERNQIPAMIMGNMGLEWRVPKENFLQAREILLSLHRKGIYVCGAPKFQL